MQLLWKFESNILKIDKIMVENFQISEDHRLILDQHYMARLIKISIVLAANTSSVDLEHYLQVRAVTTVLNSRITSSHDKNFHVFGLV